MQYLDKSRHLAHCDESNPLIALLKAIICKIPTIALVATTSLSCFTHTPTPLHADLTYTLGREIAKESFDRSELGEKWSIAKGSWNIKAGELYTKEIKDDHHAAAARYIVANQNAVYDLDFKFTDGGEIFHLGFDPAPGQLDKKGHLYSVIIKKSGTWMIQKAPNKAKPKEEPALIIATGKFTPKSEGYYHLKLVNLGEQVSASIDESSKLEGSDPSFKVSKPTLVFRCVGDGALIDNIVVHEIN